MKKYFVIFLMLVFVFAVSGVCVAAKQVPAEGQQQMQNQMQNHGEETQVKNQNVSDAVQQMLQVADRSGGVGQQIRTIAQQQNQSSGTTTQAMEKVQTRNKMQTFLFGSDYKNLGTLRSEIVQTQNRLQQLNNLMENVDNEGDKTELQNQIQTLQQEQTKIESFVNSEEKKFSLFGWLVKLFNK